MKVALIGLMQSGKSTVLSAISGKEPVMMGSTDIHEQTVPVPDDRLDWLTELYEPKKTTYATVNCMDMPGISFMVRAQNLRRGPLPCKGRGSQNPLPLRERVARLRAG